MKDESSAFWKKIGKIGVGNDRQSKIPMEVKLDYGTKTSEKSVVLEAWKSSFSNMFNQSVSSANCVNNFTHERCVDELDSVMSLEEIKSVLLKSKNGKSPGVDDIPVE